MDEGAPDRDEPASGLTRRNIAGKQKAMTKAERRDFFLKLAAKGGRNRARNLSAKKRREIAMMGAEARIANLNKPL